MVNMLAKHHYEHVSILILQTHLAQSRAAQLTKVL